MMGAVKDIFIVADNVYSPIGKTTAENFNAIKNDGTGIQLHNQPQLSPLPFYAALFGDEIFDTNSPFTKFEQLLIASVSDAVATSGIAIDGDNTILIVSTTKGNISLLESEKYGPELKGRIALSTSAKLVAKHFGFSEQPIVVSNACISGLLAIITAARLLRAGKYQHAVVTGADVISKFILSGFQSFQALSPGICTPFDEGHNGLNLGEGAGTIILSSKPVYSGNLKVEGGSVSNDANHISGPSRTGGELAHAIKRSIADSNIAQQDIGFVSSHGTGTVYNDEMETKALRLSGLGNTPLNSLKGYFGHTLGAAGLIETIISSESLRQGVVLGTPGFKKAPEGFDVNVSAEHRYKNASYFLKTASGFGGCNAALVVGK
jgi:3-oxoacyl-[acyl-carrier-protein] synthase-1